MDSRTRVFNVLEHKQVDRFPRSLGVLPTVTLFRKEEYERMLSLFDWDFMDPGIGFKQSRYQKGEVHRMPRYTDEFGCTFEVGEEGVVGEVKKAMFEDFDLLDDYEMPYEMLEDIDIEAVNRRCAKTDKFTLTGTHIRPFERMQFMRGTEDLFVDIALGEPRLEELLMKLHDFYLKELDIITRTDIDAFSFQDDWGSQVSLLISPKIWRQLFKPLYKEYVQLGHSRGKKVFFHSDGFIEDIFPDLVEIGIDAINSQLFCMDIEKLVDSYGDKTCFWGEIDRQIILPFGSIDDVTQAVDRVADSIIAKNKIRTGAIAHCEWGGKDPFENIHQAFARWSEK